MRAPSDPGATSAFDDKAHVYAQFGNGTIAALAVAGLPAGGRVLDVGCASGGLLALLDHAGFRAGIEPARDAAAQARTVADEVHHGGIEDELPWPAGSFDVVVLADVIEHLSDPQDALRRAVALARPGGLVLVSVPNVAHWRARLTILAGHFPREDSGTFDATHLQWFTVRRVTELFDAAGLTDPVVRPVVPALRNHIAGVRRLPERVERGWQAFGRRCPGLLGYQLVGSGRRPAEPGL